LLKHVWLVQHLSIQLMLLVLLIIATLTSIVPALCADQVCTQATCAM